LQYLGNNTREGHNYYVRLPGSNMQSIKWYYFQWWDQDSNL